RAQPHMWPVHDLEQSGSATLIKNSAGHKGRLVNQKKMSGGRYNFLPMLRQPRSTRVQLVLSKTHSERCGTPSRHDSSTVTECKRPGSRISSPSAVSSM